MGSAVSGASIIEVSCMELRLLGEVQLWAGDRLLDVGAPRQQAVLAALAVDAGRPVAIETLIDRVWDDTPPVGARNVLYSHLSRIRQLLMRATSLTGTAARIDRRSAGYVLEIDPDVVDLHRFTRLVEEGKNPRSADEDRAVVLTEALGLWRGTPLAGMPGHWVNHVRDDWYRRRLDAVVRWGEIELKLGHVEVVISTIPNLITEYPLAEPLENLFMRALHAAGRDAEAVERYAVVRHRLVDELGIDPGPELRALHNAILRGDLPHQAGGSNGGPVSAPPIPRQLPARTSRFVGRAEELGQLAKLLDESTHNGGDGTVVITAIDGTAGVGKTALAVHWAHRVAKRFPDGQLYVDLRGFDPTDTPVRPAEALREFLHALGVLPQWVPTSLDAQAALFRSVVADRRLLVVLDNARDAEHVRSLLPANPACLVVITSRNQLADLTAKEGARRVTLDVLTPQEARALLTRHLGHDRVNTDPDAVTDLTEQCARLPLALAIVAARADTYQGFSLRVLAKELADVHTRLEELDTGEASTSVRTVFSWSYHHLSTPAARMFRLLGLHPGPDIDLSAAARLADLDPAQTRRTLGELTRAHLLRQPTHGRYTCHNLLRAYAMSLATTQDPPDDNSSALTRLFDHYLRTTVAAIRILRPHDELWPGIPHSATVTPPITDRATAKAWLDTERTNLTAIITNSAACGRHIHATRLANILLHHGVELGDKYLDTLAIYADVLKAADRTTEASALTYVGLGHWLHGRYQQAIDHLHNANAVSRDSGNPVGEAVTLNYLGIVFWRQGHYQLATEHYQHARAISRDNNIRVTEATALNHLGVIHFQQGHYQLATERFHDAITISREIKFQLGEAFALNYWGMIHCRHHRYQQATEHHHKALALSRDIGVDRVGEALALNSLGIILCHQKHYQQATEHHHQALAICREIKFLVGEALTLTNLGVIHGHQKHYQQATDHHHQALTICREIGDRANEPQILNHLANTCHASRQLDQAHIHHTAALTLATELGDPYEQANAHHGLAHYHHTTGDHTQTRHHLQQALTHYVDLGVPHANTVHTDLTALNQSHQRPCRHENRHRQPPVE